MRRRPRATITTAALLITVMVGLTTPTGPAIAEPSDVAAARLATSAYHRTESAQQAGYALPPTGPLHECISALDGSVAAMGYHWINADLVGDATLELQRPEVLVFEPRRNGRKRLVAVEYVVFADAWQAAHPGATPALFGRPLTFVDEPNRYELPAFYQTHVWLWKHNPHGMFANHNPKVSCQYAD